MKLQEASWKDAVNHLENNGMLRSNSAEYLRQFESHTAFLEKSDPKDAYLVLVFWTLFNEEDEEYCAGLVKGEDYCRRWGLLFPNSRALMRGKLTTQENIQRWISALPEESVYFNNGVLTQPDPSEVQFAKDREDAKLAFFEGFALKDGEYVSPKK